MAALLHDILRTRNVLEVILDGRATPGALEKRLLSSFPRYPDDRDSVFIDGHKVSTLTWICECLDVLAQQGILTSDGSDLVIASDDDSKLEAALGVGATGYFDGGDSESSLEQLVSSLVHAFGRSAVQSALDKQGPTQ